jgi:hypothetical protein
MINKSSLDAVSYFYLNNNHQGIITNLGYPFLYKKNTGFGLKIKQKIQKENIIFLSLSILHNASHYQ